MIKDLTQGAGAGVPMTVTVPTVTCQLESWPVVKPADSWPNTVALLTKINHAVAGLLFAHRGEALGLDSIKLDVDFYLGLLNLISEPKVQDHVVELFENDQPSIQVAVQINGRWYHSWYNM